MICGPAAPARAPRPTVTARVLSLLAAFDTGHTRLSLTELARCAGLPLSTAHRLAHELLAWEALDRDEEGCFVVGRRLWQLGALAPVQRELREAALPAMQDLYEATHENVHLAVRDGMSALYVERLHGRSSVPLVSRAGVPLPLHATGVGKVLLAWAPAEVLDGCLADLQPATRYTITERGRLLRELAMVRRNGYARTAEEMSLGTCSVAVPVTAADGRVSASLGLVTSTVRRDLVRLAPALRVAAASIARRMAR